MTLFEYLSIATSLILSFSLARTLSNLAPIFTSRNRYWVHSIWVLLLLLNHVTLFWQLWIFQGVADWTLFEFLLLLVGPIMVLIAASLLVPVSAVSDYRVYFESIRTPAYFVLIVMQVQQIPLLYLVFGVPVFNLIHLGSVIVAGGFLVGLIGRRSGIDKVLVILFVLAVLSGLSVANDHETTRMVLESMRVD